jgi:hypothetical protein
MPLENPSFVFGEDCAPSLIVKMSTVADHTVLKCGFNEKAFGVAHEGSREAPIPGITPLAAASGESARVYGPGETCEVEVGSGIVVTAGHPVMADANSKARRGIHGMPCLGDALKTVTGPARARVFVRPHIHENGDQFISVLNAASPRAVLDYESGATFENADGAVEFDLPAAVVGLEYKFRVGHASALTVDPAAADTMTSTAGVPDTAGDAISADAVNEFLHIKCFEAGAWTIVGFTGTWTNA